MSISSSIAVTLSYSLGIFLISSYINLVERVLKYIENVKVFHLNLIIKTNSIINLLKRFINGQEEES